MVQHPARRIQAGQQQLAALWPRLPKAINRSITLSDQRLRSAAKALHLISPLATLDRGYSLSFDATGKLLRSVHEVQAGEKLVTRTRDGEVISEVTEKRPFSE